MILFVAGFGIVNFVQNRSEKPVASQLPMPSRPLFKPEPRMLLNRADLALTAKQRSAIQGIDSAWSNERTKLLKAMSAYQPKQARADQISGDLAGYSELSRTYDATRSRYWGVARNLLDKNQQALVDGGLR